MDKVDFSILKIMVEALKAIHKLKAATRDDIRGVTDIDKGTLYRRLKKLEAKGYVAKGYQEARKHTYFVTSEGENVLEEVQK